MIDDPTTIDLRSNVSAEEEKRRESARSISPLVYWELYVEYKSQHGQDPNEWTRDKFLLHLKTARNLTTIPSGSAVAGKHNYVTTKLLPSLSTDPASAWYGITAAQLDSCELPPTSRDTKEAWAQNKALADMTKKLFG